MRSRSNAGALGAAALLLVALPVGAARSATPAADRPAAIDSPAGASIDDCEALPVLPCALQVARIARPLAGTDFVLVYASDRMPGHVDGEGRDPARQGLGGWSVSAVHTYSIETGELVRGDGALRHVEALPLDDGRLVVAADDGTEVYEFDTAGRHLRTSDAVTGFVTLTVTWNEHGIETVADRSGVALTIERNADASFARLTARSGARTSLALDSAGWLAQLRGADGATTWVATRADGLVERVVSPGAESTFAYDDDGRLVEAAATDAGSATFERTEADGTVSVATTIGAATTVDSFAPADDGGWRRTHTDAVGATTTFDVAADGRRLVATADGTTAATTLGPDPRWGSQAPVLASVHIEGPAATVDLAEQRTAGIDSPDPAVAADASRTWGTADAAYSVEFNAAARTLRQRRGSDVVAEHTFDEIGRPLLSTQAGLPDATYEYGDDGQLAAYRLGTGDDARVWTYASDPDRGTMSVTSPDGTVSTIRSDAASRPVSVTRGESATRIGYDAAGRATVIHGSGDTTLTSSFSANGTPLVSSVPGAAGARASTTLLDDAGLPVSVRWSDGAVVGVERDGAGRVVGIDEGSLSYDVTFDELGRPIDVRGDGVALTSEWTGSTITGQTWSGAVTGVVNWTLDGEGRVASEAVDGSDPVAVVRDVYGQVTGLGGLSIELDAAGRPITETVGAVAIARTYNAFGELTGIDATVGGTSIFRETIERDQGGRVVTRREAADEATSTTTYGYDANSWLASVTGDAGTATFAYDADGNRISTTDASGTVTTAAYDAGDALAVLGDSSIEVDGAGRLASVSSPGGTTAYDYDRSGALQSVTTADGATVEYAVDGIGRRVGRSVDGAPAQGYLYGAGPAPIAELSPVGAVMSRIVYRPDGTTPAYLVRDGRTYAYVVDHLGSPRLLVDQETGEIAQRLDYDPWGRITADSNPGFQPLGFTGALVDPLTGLVRLGFRDYDPVAGRFTAPDPIGMAGGSANLYLYAGNSPATHRDPFGLCFFCYHPPGSGVTIISIGGSASLLVGVSGGFQITIAPDGVSITPEIGGSIGVQAGMDVGFTIGQSYTVDGSPARISDFGVPSRDESLQVMLGPLPFTVGGENSLSPDGRVQYSGMHVGANTPSEAGIAYGGEISPDWLFPSWCWGNCTPPPPPPLPGVSMPGAECGGSDAPSPCAPISCDAGNMCMEPPDPLSEREEFESGGPGTEGEPHLITVAGDRYDFQAAGEFVLMQSDDGAVVVQVRQEPVPDSDVVAFNTAVAFGVAGHRVGVYAGRPEGELWVDGEPVLLQDALDLDDGASMRPIPSGYELRWPDGSRVAAWVNVASIDVSVALSDALAGQVHGLIGAAGPGSLAGRDGTPFPLDGLAESGALYGAFAAGWLLSADESLFDYAAGETTESFHLPDFPTVVAPPTAEQLAAAEAICRDVDVPAEQLAACAYDVAVTGDASFAVARVTAADAVAVMTPPAAAGAEPGAEAPAGSVPAEADGGPVAAGGTLRDGSHAADEITAAGESHVFPLDLEGADAFYVTGWRGPAEGCDASFSVNLVGVSAGNFPCAGGTVYFVVPDGSASASLEVASSGEGVGTYRFDIVTVKPRFPLAVGDTVSPDEPDGAGSLDVPGRLDRYTFAADGAAAVALTGVTENCATTVTFAVLEANGNLVRGGPLCGEIAPIALPDPNGTYVLEVRSATLVVEDYAFHLEATEP